MMKLDISAEGFLVDGNRIDFTGKSVERFFEKNAEGNCAIFYSFNLEDSVFIHTMEIWTSKDNLPLSEEDLNRIEELQKKVGFVYKNKERVCASINCSGGSSHAFMVSTGYEFIDYECTCYEKTKIGLRCFILSRILDGKYTSAAKESKFPQLIRSIQDNNIDHAVELIRQGADVNFMDPLFRYRPIDFAVALGRPEICELLIRSGADFTHGLDWYSFSSLLGISYNENTIDCGKVLVAHGIQYDIFSAIEYDPSYLEFLLKCGVDANRGIRDGLFNPLMYAVLLDKIPAAKLLLEYGADVNALTLDNGNALAISVLLNHKEMAGLLIEHGAKINAMTDGQTVLSYGLNSKSIDCEMLRLLTFCGAAINVPISNHSCEPFQMLIPVINGEDLDLFLALVRLTACI